MSINSGLSANKSGIQCLLGDLFEFEYGKSLTVKERKETGVFPVLGSNGVIGYHDKYLIKGPAIIVGRKGAVGEVTFIDRNFWPIDTSYYVKVSDSLDIKFSFYLLKSLILGRLDKSTAIPGLNRNDAYVLTVMLLPLVEQRAIVAKLEQLFSELDKGVENLKKAQAQLKVFRQAVLKWAFEGKLTQEWRKQQKELPEKWKLLKLKDITNEKDGLRRGPFGSAIKKEFFVSDGYKVYEQGNAINNDPYRGTYYVSEEKFNELINFKVVPGDLIVSCSGVTLGRISEIPEDAKPGIINQALLRIRLKQDLIKNKFFIIHFRAAFFQKMIFDQSQGTAMPNLVGIKDFKEIELLIPPIEEQDKIVQEIEDRLSVCDKLEETISQSLQKAESLRQSILKKAFEGKLLTDAELEEVRKDPDWEPAEKLLERIQQEKQETQKTGKTK